MKKIDTRFTPEMINLLKGTIGQTFIKFRADPFKFSNSVFEYVGLFIGEQVLLLSNSQHDVDYFGAEDEEIVLLELHCVKSEDIHSGFVDVEQIDTPIKRKIKEVHLVQENQKLYENGNLTYDVYLTRGIIFIMDDGYEVSFEKEGPFIETIAICRGENVINNFLSKDRVLDWVEPPQSMDVVRSIEVVS